MFQFAKNVISIKYRHNLKYKIVTSLFFVQFLILNLSVYSQSKNEKEYFQWFDNITDSRNSNLSNGVSYSEEYVTKKGYHEYYLTLDFLIGDIVYDQQHYSDVNLQYNLFTDEVILRYYKNDNLRTIQLIKDKVKEFIIDGKKFIKVKKQNKDKAEFYESLFEHENLKLLKKHLKKRQKHVENGLVYYSFKKKSNYSVILNDKLHRVDTKRSILKLFPDQKKKINDFFSKKNYLNNNKEEFMKLLFKQITNK